MKYLVLAAILLISALSGCGSSTPERGQQQGLNLLLISIDSLRPDRLGLYGHLPRFAPQLSTSPNLDRLAQQAWVFDQAWSSTSWTLPAHASLFTGLDDPGHGVFNEDFKLDPGQQTLAEFLSLQGYRCYGVYSGTFLKPTWGFDRGFDHYQAAFNLAQDLPEQEQRQALLAEVSSPRVNQIGEQFLQQAAQEEEPFFLFLHYFDVHFDYQPQAADPTLASQFDPDYAGTMTAQNWHSNPQVRNPKPPFERRIGDRDLAHVEALYDGEIHWVDRHIGQILQQLEQLGLADNTVVAVVSDHGDEFFEHGSIGHQNSLYPEVTRMAFVLHLPSIQGLGQRSSRLTSMMDVAPTLLDAMEVKQPWPQAMGHSVLRPKPEQAASGVFSHLIATTTHGIQLGECWRGDRYTVMRPFSHRVSERGTLELSQKLFPDDSPAYFVFDRLLDPQETRPISPQDPVFHQAVEQMVRDFGKQQKLRSQVPRSEHAQRLTELAPGSDEMKALMALGYAESSPSKAEQAVALPIDPLPAPRLPAAK